MNYKFFLLHLILSIILITSLQAEPTKIIIIGASAGIGRQLAKELAKNNNCLLGLTARRTELLATLQEELPVDSIIKYMDVRDAQSSRATLEKLINQMGGLDIIILNAGVWADAAQGIIPNNKILSWDLEYETIQVNNVGFVALANTAINYFIQQGHGHIVGISSISALRGESTCPVYCATKAFVSRYLEGIRNKFIQAGLDIHVTDILPGYVDTYQMGPKAYWVTSVEDAAQQIVESINAKDKVAYISRRQRLIAWLLALTPDWIYNKMGGF